MSLLIPLNLYNEATLGFESNPKEFASETNIKLFGHLPQAPGQMSFLLKCASANLRGFFLFLYIFFSQPSQVYMGSIPESQLKSKLVIP